MPGPGNVLIKIGADAGQAIRELNSTDKALGSTMSTSEKMSAGVKKAALPAAAALGAIGFAAIGATKAAMEDAAAQEHLSGVLKRTTGATDDAVKATEDWISGISRATGVSDDELRPALETLVTATGSVSKAQKDMKRALDISAASGKSVEEVSKAMALAHTGQTAKLEKLIPGLSETAKASDDMNVIMKELAVTTGGAMAESADTAAGQMKIMKNQTAELQESLGMALLPVVEALVPLMVGLADVASENTTAIKILIGVVAGIAAAILAVNAALKIVTAAQYLWTAATKAAQAAQWLWNVAISSNPIGLIIIALVALGAALVVAYQKSETFRNIVDGALDVVRNSVAALDRAFDALKAAAAATFNWIVDHWKLALFAFGPIGAAVYLVVTRFEQIENAARSAFNFIIEKIQAVINAIQTLIEWLGKIKFPSVPKVFRKLPGLGRAAVAPAMAGVSRGAAAPSAAAGGGVTVNVYGAVDPEGTARAIKRILAGHERRQGRTV